MGSCNCWDGRNKRRVGLLSPHLPQRSPPFFFTLGSAVILTVFIAVMLMLNTLPWDWQARSFLVPLRRRENTPAQGRETRAGLVSSEKRADWKESTAATSPATG